MDLYKTIRELVQEKERLDQVIASLEQLAGEAASAEEHRGRKAMSEAEKQRVSERMKKYWEQRRKNRTAAVR